MVAKGTGSLVLIDDMTADKSSRVNSEVYCVSNTSPFMQDSHLT